MVTVFVPPNLLNGDRLHGVKNSALLFTSVGM